MNKYKKVKIIMLVLVFYFTMSAILPAAAIEKFDKLPDVSYILKKSTDVLIISKSDSVYGAISKYWECIYKNNKLHILYDEDGSHMLWLESDNAKTITNINDFSKYAVSVVAVMSKQFEKTSHIMFYARVNKDGKIYHILSRDYLKNI